ncbi:sigma-70 family RNA polymerase sigma factor [Patescibacteria group bacterium]|nr:sigma-70 family RNA polymerase sigma factor [Patescibacteria group bacterium]
MLKIDYSQKMTIENYFERHEQLLDDKQGQSNSQKYLERLEKVQETSDLLSIDEIRTQILDDISKSCDEDITEDCAIRRAYQVAHNLLPKKKIYLMKDICFLLGKGHVQALKMLKKAWIYPGVFKGYYYQFTLDQVKNFIYQNSICFSKNVICEYGALNGYAKNAENVRNVVERKYKWVQDLSGKQVLDLKQTVGWIYEAVCRNSWSRPKEVSEALDLSLNTVRRLLNKNIIPNRRFGRDFFVNPDRRKEYTKLIQLQKASVHLSIKKRTLKNLCKSRKYEIKKIGHYLFIDKRAVQGLAGDPVIEKLRLLNNDQKQAEIKQSQRNIADISKEFEVSRKALYNGLINHDLDYYVLSKGIYVPKSTEDKLRKMHQEGSFQRSANRMKLDNSPIEMGNYYSLAEFSQKIGINPGTVRDQLKNHKIESILFDKYLIPHGELDRVNKLMKEGEIFPFSRYSSSKFIQQNIEMRQRLDEGVRWKLVKAYRRNRQNKIALEALVSNMGGMVKSIANRYKHCVDSMTFEDLVQYGYIGLLKAIEKCGERKNSSFSHYAYIRIRGEILDAIQACDRMIRIPQKKFYNSNFDNSQFRVSLYGEREHLI